MEDRIKQAAERTLMREYTALATFMGLIIEKIDGVPMLKSNAGDLHPIDTLEYRHSWDTLYAIINRFEDEEFLGARFYVTIGTFEVSGYCSGVPDKGLFEFTKDSRFERLSGDAKKKAVYDMLVAAANWYNAGKHETINR